MTAVLADAEATGVDASLLDRGKAKLRDAEKAQAKKRERERLERVQQRREMCTVALTAALAARVESRQDPLKVDLKALRATVSEADELATEPGDDDDHVKPRLVKEVTAWLEVVEAAWAEKRAEIEAQLISMTSVALPSVDVDALRQACSMAEMAGVEQEAVGVAHKVLASATKRDLVASKLGRLVAMHRRPGHR